MEAVERSLGRCPGGIDGKGKVAMSKSETSTSVGRGDLTRELLLGWHIERRDFERSAELFRVPCRICSSRTV